MDALDIVVGLLLTVFLVWNQLRTRPVTPRRLITLPLIVIVLGLLQRGPILGHNSLGVLLLALGLALAVVLGTARGFAVKIWVGPDGGYWRRGGALLVALWLTSVAVKVGLDVAGGLGGAGIGGAALLIELGVTLGAQNLVVAGRSFGWDRLFGGAAPGVRNQ